MAKQKLTASQKQQVGQFQGITGASKEQAADCLQSSSWNVEVAINLFFNSGLTGGPSKDNSAALSLFERYQEQQQGAILADGNKLYLNFNFSSQLETLSTVAQLGLVELQPRLSQCQHAGVGRFCQDLRVDPSDIVMLVLSWHFAAATMCEFSKDEFLEGMEDLNCNSIESLRRKLPQLRSELKNEQTFQEIYNYAYGFACEKGQKCLQLDTALAMWHLLFAEQGWPLVKSWCDFLEANHKHAISKDTWSQLLDFAKIVRTKSDVKEFDASSNSAWPYLIDDFVDQLRAEAD